MKKIIVIFFVGILLTSKIFAKLVDTGIVSNTPNLVYLVTCDDENIRLNEFYDFFIKHPGVTQVLFVNKYCIYYDKSFNYSLDNSKSNNQIFLVNSQKETFQVKGLTAEDIDDMILHVTYEHLSNATFLITRDNVTFDRVTMFYAKSWQRRNYK